MLNAAPASTEHSPGLAHCYINSCGWDGTVAALFICCWIINVFTKPPKTAKDSKLAKHLSAIKHDSVIRST